MKNKTRIFVSGAILIALLLSGMYAFRGYVSHQALGTLANWGFKSAEISRTSYYGASIAFEDINLDKEGFSTIEGIRSNIANFLPFLSHNSPIIIDGLTLSGDINFPIKYEVSGWNPLSTSNDITARNLILNDAKLDLMTSKGAIRLQAKGLVNKDSTGNTTINGALWGVQHQLNIDTRWNGKITADGNQSHNIEVLKGTINLDYLSVSRLSGNLTLNWPVKNTYPDLDGELVIGKLDVAGIPLNSAKLKMSGPVNRQTIVFEGYIAGKSIMQAGIRLEQGENDTQVQAAINAKHLDDLLGFLEKLRANVNQSTWGVGIFMPLMLTKGNLERIRNDMNGIPYDELQMVITGSLRDMTGKIVAFRKNDAEGEKHIISLDPGFVTE